MTDNPVVLTLLNLSLVVTVALMIPATYRILRGPRIADRMLGVDMITNLLVASIVLLGAILEIALLVDVALALAALSFIGSLAVASFVTDGKVF
ncbi:MAG: monovalent cation/H+ antiporter complex subunit F [Chloroflexota bacterium]